MQILIIYFFRGWTVLMGMIISTLSAQELYVRTYEVPGDAEITSLEQDSRGFIWIGTSQGLKRFDGLAWESYTRPDSITEAKVSAIAEVQKGELWVGYSDGKIFIYKGQDFYAFSPEEGLPKVSITNIQTDKKGNIWFSTYGEGIYYWKDQRLYNINKDDGLSDDDVYVMVRDPFGKMWAGTDRGINICWLDSSEKKIKYINQEKGLPDNIVRSLASDDEGNIWVGMYEGGVGQYNIEEGKFTSVGMNTVMSKSPISALEYLGNQIWVGTETGEIWTGNQSLRKLDFQSLGTINCLQVDREGNIWIGGEDKDLCMASSRFIRYPLQAYDLRSIACGYDGNIWLGTIDGLISFDPQKGYEKVFSQTKGLNIVSVFEDVNHEVWLGTLGKGLYRLSPSTGYIQHYNEQNGLINDNILSIEGDSQYIWLATLGGASRFKIPQITETHISFTNFDQDDGLGIDYIYDIFIDSHKNVWFATDGKGVNHYRDGVFFSHEELLGETVFSMIEDHRGVIWLGTESGNIYYYNNGRWQRRLDTMLSANRAIRGIGVDKYDQLMFIFDQKIELLDASRSLTYSFGQSQGLEDLNPDLNIWSEDVYKRIWFVSDQGLMLYQPIPSGYLLRPQPVIEHISVYLTPIDTSLLEALSYNQNHVSFSFRGLWFTSPSELKYQYKLEGYDLGWITTGDHTVSFPQLRPGNYTFKLKASLASNGMSSDILSVPFTIRQPFWLQRWFILIAAAFLVISLVGFIRFREKRIQEKQVWEKEKIEYQFETLKSQINPHFLFNSFNTLISVIEKNQDMAVEYVEQLSIFFRNILEYRNEETISLKKEIDLLKNYYFLQKRRYGTWLELIIEIPQSEWDSRIPPLTLQILLENAIKHNVIDEEHHLIIHILVSGQQLWIKNNLQLKRNKAPSTRVGLTNIKSRYSFITHLPIEIVHDQLEFIVKLPLIQHHVKRTDSRR